MIRMITSPARWHSVQSSLWQTDEPWLAPFLDAYFFTCVSLGLGDFSRVAVLCDVVQSVQGSIEPCPLSLQFCSRGLQDSKDGGPLCVLATFRQAAWHWAELWTKAMSKTLVAWLWQFPHFVEVVTHADGLNVGKLIIADVLELPPAVDHGQKIFQGHVRSPVAGILSLPLLDCPFQILNASQGDFLQNIQHQLPHSTSTGPWIMPCCPIEKPAELTEVAHCHGHREGHLLPKAEYQDAYGSSTDKYDSSCTLMSPLTSLKA